jgi:succinylarginine dihydrolase
MSETKEVNFDGIVGQTHNYCGLSYGNVASIDNKGAVSNPKAAALQGLKKMYELYKMGVRQAIIPPLPRPFLPVLRQIGFSGPSSVIIRNATHDDINLLYAVSSSAAMWTANAATVTPSVDSDDSRVQITIANLSAKFHRSIEAPTMYRIFQTIFKDETFFRVYPALPQGNYFSDEGAANHTRLCNEYGDKGINFFVYGRSSFTNLPNIPKNYPARQTLEASHAVVRLNAIDRKHVVFAQQNPEAVDAGVFHNDVIAVGNQNVFFYHEKAYVDKQKVIDELKRKADELHIDLKLIEVTNDQVSLQDAVKTYLFNSQLVTLPDKTMALIAPAECQENPQVKGYIESLIKQNTPIKTVKYFNLRESMCNGGGPACLRLRIVLRENELRAMHNKVLLDDKLYQTLCAWVEKNYRDHLTPNDLSDPLLHDEVKNALDELTKILDLGDEWYLGGD